MKEKVEIMLKQTANSPSIAQIPIHVADLQKYYGHKSSDIEIQQVESCRHKLRHNNGPTDQCRHNNGPKIWISVGSCQQ